MYLIYVNKCQAQVHIQVSNMLELEHEETILNLNMCISIDET